MERPIRHRTFIPRYRYAHKEKEKDNKSGMCPRARKKTEGMMKKKIMKGKKPAKRTRLPTRR